MNKKKVFIIFTVAVVIIGVLLLIPTKKEEPEKETRITTSEEEENKAEEQTEEELEAIYESLEKKPFQYTKDNVRTILVFLPGQKGEPRMLNFLHGTVGYEESTIVKYRFSPDLKTIYLQQEGYEEHGYDFALEEHAIWFEGNRHIETDQKYGNELTK